MASLVVKFSLTLVIFLAMGMTSINKEQPCRQIVIDDATQQRMLIKYIEESVRKGAFVDDKGVVTVTRFEHESKRPAWLVTSVVDDRYKENPPVEWARLHGDIILFYDTVSSRYDIIKHVATAELIQCLDEAIGDRLYIRPIKRDRWIEINPTGNKPIRVKSGRIFSGHTHNDKVWIFEADGSVTTLIPV